MARPSYPSDRHEQFMVRLPEGMRERIRASAEQNGRSMNAEIVATLLQTYPPQRSLEELAAEIRGLLKEYRRDGRRHSFQKLEDALTEAVAAEEDMNDYDRSEDLADDGRENEDDNRPMREE